MCLKVLGFSHYCISISYSSFSFTFCIKVSLSHVQLFVTPWTVACQASLSIGFSKQEYWSGLPFPPSGAFPDPRKTSPVSPALQADSLPAEPLRKPLCRSGSNSSNWTWNNRLVPNRKRTTSRLYSVCRVHHEKCWAGRSTSWNQDCLEKYQ